MILDPEGGHRSGGDVERRIEHVVWKPRRERGERLPGVSRVKRRDGFERRWDQGVRQMRRQGSQRRSSPDRVGESHGEPQRIVEEVRVEARSECRERPVGHAVEEEIVEIVGIVGIGFGLRQLASDLERARQQVERYGRSERRELGVGGPGGSRAIDSSARATADRRSDLSSPSASMASVTARS